MIIDEYKGVFVPLITPFSVDHLAINYEYIRQQLEFLQKRGVTGIVLTGDEGEFPSLSFEERKSIITWVMKFRQQLKIIIHTGTNSLVETTMLSQFAGDQDADALLIGAPSYFLGITEAGFIDYFYEIFKRVQHPTFLYNSPNQPLTPGVIAQLHEFPYFCGIIDAGQNWDASLRLMQEFSRLHLIVGNDQYIINAIEQQAGGILSSIANAFPDLIMGLYHSMQQRLDATYLQQKLLDHLQLCNRYPMTAMLKHLLFMLGFEPCAVRPPLLNLTSAQKKQLERDLAHQGLIV